MSGKFRKPFLRRLQSTSLFFQTCRSFRLPVSYTIGKRYASFFAKSTGTNSYIINSNCMSDNEIYTKLKQHVTISRYLGLTNGSYPVRQLRNMSDIFFPNQPSDPKSITLPPRIQPENVQQQLISKADRASLDVGFSKDGQATLLENRGATERCLALLPKEGFDDTVSATEKTLFDFDQNFKIVSAKLLDIDEYFPISVLTVDFKLGALLLQHTRTFSEAVYESEDAKAAPYDTLDAANKETRLTKVLQKKFGVTDNKIASEKFRSIKDKKRGR